MDTVNVIPKNYEGNVMIKILRVYDDIYSNNEFIDLENKTPIIRKAVNYGTKTFIHLNNISLEVVYCPDNKVYESVNPIEGIYLVKVLSLI